MKKIFLFILTLIFFASCDETSNLVKTYESDSFVSFKGAGPNITVGENQGTAQIPFTMSTASAQDVTVVFKVENETAVSGTHFTFPTLSVVVPAGQYGGNLALNLVDDVVFNASRTFKLTILSNSANFKIGLGVLADSSIKKVIIVNNDCPTRSDLWFGSLNVEDVGYGSTRGTGSANATGTCDVLRVDNDLPGYGGQTIYDINLVPSAPNSLTGRATILPTISRANLTATTNAVLVGTGTYNQTTKTITIDYILQERRIADNSIVRLIYSGTNIITKL